MMNQSNKEFEHRKSIHIKTIGMIFLIVAIVFFIAVPVFYYAMLSIPYADDFSYASTMKAYLVQDSNPFLAAYRSMLQFYNTLGGEWFSDYLAFFFSQFECSNLAALRIVNLVSHLFLGGALAYLISSFLRDVNKAKTMLSTIIISVIFLYWMTNNYCNTEIYTWHIVCVKYVLSMAVLCLGVGSYVRYFHHQYRRYWILAMIIGILVNGTSLNIAMLNCELYCLLMLYGIIRKRLIWQSIIVSTVPLVSVLVTLVAPGNFSRYGNETFYIGGCILGCLYAVLDRIVYLSIHTPYLVMSFLVFLWLLAHIKPESSTERKKRHPLILLPVFFLCVLGVDSPYVMSLKIQRFEFTQFEDRALFVQDFSIYLFTIVWIIYFAKYVKGRFPKLELKRGVAISCLTAGIALSVLIIGLNDIRTMTTVRMWEGIAKGNAITYARYQETILQQIEASDQAIVDIVYDTTKAGRKDEFILGLRLSEDEGRWDYWYNGAVANFCDKEKINITYE